jgi:predicted unusual protein kinase regulating ubiquinone biosynthesis (AarF/ABC1/UbiB family)
MFADDPDIRIPLVYGSHTTVRVLTLEDVYFIKIIDYDAIEAAGVARAEVADRLFQTYLGQIFIEGFFHADPHPGNLFVEPLEDGTWRLVFVDFGMVGEITPVAKSGMRDLAIAIGARDMDRLMRAYQTLGVLLPSADLDRIRAAEAALYDRIWGKSMRELIRTHPQEMRQFAKEFRDVLYEMPFQVPEDFIFLGRCLSILSGMCTGLNPDFNLFEGLRPFAEQLIAEEVGDSMGEILELLMEQLRALVTLPGKADAVLGKIQRGEVMVTARAAPELARQIRDLSRRMDRVSRAVVFSAVLITSALLYTSGEQLLGGIGLGLASLILVWFLRG